MAKLLLKRGGLMAGTRALINSHTEVGPGVKKLVLDWQGGAQPGQFVQVALNTAHDPLLRRPISVHNHRAGELTLLYRVSGRGTALLAEKTPGEMLDVLGPLGSGFPLTAGGTAILIAGGIGVAPLYFLAASLREAGCQVIFLYGAKTASELYILPELARAAGEMLLATDDGSAGYHGLVTDLAATVLSREKAPVYTCGPEPMMREVVRLARENGRVCYVSVEARMACGVGACQGCAVPAEGGYLRACTEGPVFAGGEVFK